MQMIILKWVIEWVLLQYDGCPYKKGNLDTETGMLRGKMT